MFYVAITNIHSSYLHFSHFCLQHFLSQAFLLYSVFFWIVCFFFFLPLLKIRSSRSLFFGITTYKFLCQAYIFFFGFGYKIGTNLFTTLVLNLNSSRKESAKSCISATSISTFCNAVFRFTTFQPKIYGIFMVNTWR